MAFQETRQPILLGEYTPYLVTKNGDIVTAGFVQSARLYKLDLRMANARQYLRQLSLALKKDMPVKVMVYKDSDDIASVTAASEAAQQRYIDAKKKP